MCIRTILLQINKNHYSIIQFGTDYYIPPDDVDKDICMETTYVYIMVEVNYVENLLFNILCTNTNLLPCSTKARVRYTM